MTHGSLTIVCSRLLQVQINMRLSRGFRSACLCIVCFVFLWVVVATKISIVSLLSMMDSHMVSLLVGLLRFRVGFVTVGSSRGCGGDKSRHCFAPLHDGFAHGVTSRGC